MASLPTVGADVGTWGTELNEFLLVEHDTDGTHTFDSDLVAIAGLAPSNDDLLQRKAGAWTNRTPAQVKTDLALAKADVGLGSADNTTDVGKPVSTAQQAALDLKAPLASPTFTGSIVTPIVAGDGTTVKLRPEGAADDDGELRVTKAAAGTKLTFTSADGSTADVNLYRSGVDALKTDNNLSIVGGISALNGTGNEVALGVVGPGAQPAIRFSGDTTFYRGSAGSLRTQGDLVTEGVLWTGSDMTLYTAGKTIKIAEGANAKMGVATLVGGTVTVSTTAVTASSRIMLSVQSLGTVTVATPVAVTARTAATSFVITSAAGTDTSVVAWFMLEPA